MQTPAVVKPTVVAPGSNSNRWRFLRISYLVIFNLVFLYGTSFGQIDSLLSKLALLPNDTNRAITLNELAYQHWNINPLKGVDYGHAALQLADSLDYQKGMAVAYKTIGVCYWSMGSYEPALRAFFDGLKIAEEIGDHENINRIEHNMALVHEDMGNADQAIYFFRKNIDWYERTGQRGELPRVYNNIGTVFFQQGLVDSSLINYQSALTVTDLGENIDEAKYIFINMSEALFLKKDYGNAREYLNKAIEIYTRDNDISGLVECYSMAGKLYLSQRQFGEARINFDKALSLAIGGSFQHFYGSLYRSIAQLDSAQGNFKDAFLNFRKATLFQDSLNNFRQKSEYERLLIQHRTDQKEKENQLLKQANLINQIKMEDNKRLMLIVIIGSVSILGLIVFFSQKRAEYQRQLEEAELQHKIRHEKERIAQDLHDNIGTQLTSLSLGLSKFAKDHSLEADKWNHLNQSVHDTMLELRDTIWAINNEEITLEQLGDKINNLFWRMRQSSPTDYALIMQQELMDKKLKPTEAINLFRIIQEAINNSVQHGTASKIKVAIESDSPSRLIVSIEDDGCGFKWGEATSEEHYGLSNMRRRAEEVGGELRIFSESGKGTRINLSLILG
jgi:signal transduction histidine kinase